jgi:hypothetical protein
MSYHYVGSELTLFAAATNWKAYVGQVLGCYIAGRVLEVGAGIGGNTGHFDNSRVSEWTCLEPDPDLTRLIGERVQAGEIRPTAASSPARSRIFPGTPSSTRSSTSMCSNTSPMTRANSPARAHLADQGKLVVLAPAHQYLFSPFDTAVGHYRRYGRASLRAQTPPGCQLEAFLMLDCAGFFASLANRLMLNAALPSKRQIAVWDKLLVPVSRRLDPLTGHKFGKTAVAVWRAAA